MIVAKTLTEMSNQELATLLASETFRIRRIADEINRRSGR